MRSDLPIAEIAHAVPGRARLRIPAHRDDSEYFSSVAAGLSAIPGVSRIEARPSTGSIVVWHFSPLEQIIRDAQSGGLFVTNDHEPPRVLAAVPVGPRLIAGTVFGTLAVWQMTRGRVLPPALTLALLAIEVAGWMRFGASAPLRTEPVSHAAHR